MFKLGVNYGLNSLKSFSSTKGSLAKTVSKGFSHGPFNPTNYKHKSVGTRRLT